MKIVNQVVSLDIAKRLKELGVKQESLFYWHRPIFKKEYSDMDELNSSSSSHPENNGQGWYTYSTFTVAELGEMLPEATMSYRPYNMQEPQFFCERHHKSASIRDLSFNAPTEADARGKMLIYLLENKLMTL